MRLLRFTAVLFAALACACSPSGEALMDDYLARLSRAADTALPAPAAAVIRPEYPPRRALTSEIEVPSIDWFEFWDFRHCGLAQLLGERNSILGKHAGPTAQFHMDGRILRTLGRCLSEAEDKELQTLARQLIATKREQWPQRYANASVGGEALQRFWSYATAPLSADQSASIAEAEQALALWAQAGESPQSEDWPTLENLEHANQALHSRLGGSVVKAQRLATEKLRLGNRVLNSAAHNKTLCPLGQSTPEVEIARAVLNRHFIARVQPYIAAINQRSLQLRSAFDRLAGAQAPATRETLAPFQQALETLHQDFLEASRAHVKGWKRLFQHCGEKAAPR